MAQEERLLVQMHTEAISEGVVHRRAVLPAGLKDPWHLKPGPRPDHNIFSLTSLLTVVEQYTY